MTEMPRYGKLNEVLERVKERNGREISRLAEITLFILAAGRMKVGSTIRLISLHFRRV